MIYDASQTMEVDAVLLDFFCFFLAGASVEEAIYYANQTMEIEAVLSGIFRRHTLVAQGRIH